MQKNYKTYQASDFLEDDYFINWVRYPDTASDEFWNTWKKSSPPNLDEMELAAQHLKAIFSAERILPENEEAEILWQHIENTINRSNDKIVSINEHATKGRYHIMKSWWVAASVGLLLLIATSYFLLNNEKKLLLTTIASDNKGQQDIAPGGNKAILTLADGTKVILDSANNGAITKQGNVTVIKMNDGLLSYEKSAGKDVEVVYNTISTPRGGQYQLVLADGSKVWLNAASSITYPTAFAGNERKVSMTGEAYFEIKHNEQVPFLVKVGSMEVKVLGTHFNIHAYGDENNISTTLLQGSVLVSEGIQKVKLEPGQQAQLHTPNKKLQTIGNVNLEEVMAWKNGFFQFNNAGVDVVMKEISRWYDVEVSYPQGIPNEKFWGSIRRDQNLSDVFKVLQESGGHFKIEGGKVEVLP